MKKLILFLLLFTGYLQAQTLPSPSYNATTTNTLKIKTPATVSTVNFLSTNEADGSVSKIAPINVNIPYTPVNYSLPTPTIGNHLAGIDTRLGQISTTSAGITQRVNFTADIRTVNGVDYFASSLSGKGTTASGNPSALVLPDNTKGFFNKDLISIAQPAPTIGYAGLYSGNLTVSATPTPPGVKQRFTVEIYRTDNLGNPIASGVSGAPVGDLGVTVVATLDSGELNLTAGAITNVLVSGVLTQNITLNTGERLRYHVSAAKVGAGGTSVTFGVYYGNAYNSYYDVPVAIRSNSVLDDSDVPGAVTVTDALNTLNTTKANDAAVLHKTGDTFTESLGFPPLLSYNTDTSIGKRFLDPESSRLQTANTAIIGWGDSFTQGGGCGSNSYMTTLGEITGFSMTNRGVGGETSTQIKDRFIADTGDYDKTVIIWAGRNNSSDATTVKADIATMIAALTHTRYIVVSIMNGNGEGIGTGVYNNIVALNNDLKAIYGSKYVDVRSYLVSLHNNTTQDLADFANDIPPTSLRSDNLHPNCAGYTAIAEYFNKYLGVLLNQNEYFQSKDFKYYFDLYEPVQTVGNYNQTITGNKTFTNTLTVSPADVTVVGKGTYKYFVNSSLNNSVFTYQNAFWNGSAFIGSAGYGVGNGALSANGGINSNGHGFFAASNNTGSSFNGFGNQSGQFNVGNDSGAFGGGSLQYNLGITSNGFGGRSLQYNIAGTSNGFGYLALQYNLGASSNVIGTNAGRFNAGATSFGLGTSTIELNTGVDVNAVGGSVLRYNQGGKNNVIGNNSYNTFLSNALGNKTFDFSAINTTTKTITVTDHNFGITGNYVNLMYTQGSSAIGGWTSGSIMQFKIVDANTLLYSELLSNGQRRTVADITSSGTGTGHTFTPQFVYSNVNIIGSDIQPTGSGQTWIGTDSTTDSFIRGRVILGSTTSVGSESLQVTGNSSFSGRIKSTLTPGISPFEITSTTVNTNLNADLLDGQHASYFAPNTLTGYVSGAGTVSSTDTVLQAIQKLNGNDLITLNGSAVLDFPSTAAGSSSELTITVTGASEGDVVALGITNSAVLSNSCYTARVSAANTVTVRFNNYSSSSADPGSGTFKTKIFKN